MHLFARHWAYQSNLLERNAMNASISTPAPAATQTPIQISWESVTPTRAALWIKQTQKSEFKQRSLGSGVVRKYIGEMERDDWHSHTADIIRLGMSGGMEVIIDGQHRLNAIVKSNKPQDMFVARNVPLDAFKYIDQGNTRTLKDVMDCSGWTNTPTVSAAARYIWVYSETGSPFGTVRPERNLSAGSLFDWVDDYTPSIRHSWEAYGDMVRKARKGIKMSEAIMFYLWMQMSEKDYALAYSLFESMDVESTNQLPNQNFKFAIALIRDLQEKMLRAKKEGLKSRSDEHRDPCTLALVFAWNATRRGKVYEKIGSFKAALTKAGFKWDIE